MTENINKTDIQTDKAVTVMHLLVKILKDLFFLSNIDMKQQVNTSLINETN